MNKNSIYLWNSRKVVFSRYYIMNINLSNQNNFTLLPQIISGPLLIGQNDSLGPLLLVDICIEFKKARNDLTDTFGS